MAVILNYKAYFEAFRLGAVEKGYTAVARLLFMPLFDPKGLNLKDENDEPYAVDNQNAPAWAHGTEPIPLLIQKAVGKDETLQIIIQHFESNEFTKGMSEATQDEMFDAMIELINESDLREVKKKALLKYYNTRKYREFMARLFQRALLGDNKVVSSRKKKKAEDKDHDSVNEFKTIIKKKPRTKVPKTVQEPELGYVQQLYSVFSDATGVIIKQPEDLDSFNYRDQFERQRKSFYMAETVYHETRDSVTPDENDPFDDLKDEVEEGVYETVHDDYAKPLEKLNKVLTQAAKVPISTQVDDSTFHWVGPFEKKGVVHMLVNDERIKWTE